MASFPTGTGTDTLGEGGELGAIGYWLSAISCQNDTRHVAGRRGNAWELRGTADS